MAAFDEALKDKLDKTAVEFSHTLELLAGAYEDAFEKVVRKTVFDLYGSIIRRSPVDTGTYRASHMIANHVPSGDEGVHKIAKGGGSGSTALAFAKVAGWSWRVGDGTIFIFNNLPYAEPLENGHSGQAPEGVYNCAMLEIDAIMKKQIVALAVKDFFK